ncbi:MAG: type IV pilin protein [Betaproteobacteria bacterium]
MIAFVTRPRCVASHRTERGFTVLEVIVVVTLVGILAALVVPSYAVHVARSRVLDATMRLADHRAKMEQYFLDRRSFADTAGACGVAPAASAAGDAFDVGCLATASTYRITATGRTGGGMAGFAFAVDETGARTTLAVPTGWTRTPDCWTSRPDGGCL